MGIESVQPTQEELRQWFVPGCYAVKRGELRTGGELLSLQARALRDRGAERLVLACTEVPIALAEVTSPHLAVSIDPQKHSPGSVPGYGWRNARHGIKNVVI